MPFVSFRLSEDDRNRLRAMLAGSGHTLQEFMEKIVRDSLESQRLSGGPHLAETVKTIRQHKDELCGRHVAHLWIFGSIARGEERVDSDIDVVVELDPKSSQTYLKFQRRPAAARSCVG